MNFHNAVKSNVLKVYIIRLKPIEYIIDFIYFTTISLIMLIYYALLYIMQ